MAIQPGNYIVYQDLIDYIMAVITNACKNVDGFDTDVPNYLKNGVTYTIMTGRSGAKATGKVEDSVCSVVSSSIIRQQLNSFLAARGLQVANNTVISFKHIMNFFNNISSFLAAKLTVVSNSFYDTKKLFYNAGNETYQFDTQWINGNVDFSNSDVKDTMQKVIQCINNTSKTHYVNTIITFVCCSSSSSSSSSSSCSSSSSLFIAYMDI